MIPHAHRWARTVALVLAPTLALLALARPARSQEPPERPFLWRIEGAVPSYLFGTIHLPDPRVTALHPSVEAAIDRCDALFTELPMDLKTMTGAALKMRLPGRTRLDGVLPKAVYERLVAFLDARGLPIEPFQNMKVWAVAAQLPLIDHLAQIAQGTPLDMQLYRRAADDGKQVGGIETVDEQVGVFDGLTADEQCQLMTDALDQIEEMAAAGEDPVEKLVALYRAGDGAALIRMMHESGSGDPALQRKIEDSLLWSRNGRMAERIAEKIRADPDRSVFVAVGAAHLPEARGVVALLRAQGFEVTRVPESAAALEERIRELEAELERVRARLRALRKAG